MYFHAISQTAALPPAPVFTPLSPLDSFTLEQLDIHIWALRAEAFQRRFRPLVMRLMESHTNAGTFNVPVNPDELGIPDYLAVVRQVSKRGAL